MLVSMISKKMTVAMLMAIALPSLSSASLVLPGQNLAMAQVGNQSVNRRADDLLASANAKTLRNDNSASQLAQQAYDLYKQNNNIKGQQQALYTLGWSHLIQNNFDAAISAAQTSYSLLPKSVQGIEASSLLGLTYLFKNEPKQAVMSYQKGIDSAQQLRNPFALSDAYQSIELAYTSLGQYQNSINALNNAIQVDQQHRGNSAPSPTFL